MWTFGGGGSGGGPVVSRYSVFSLPATDKAIMPTGLPSYLSAGRLTPII